jgi:hypothetical protein
VLIVAIFLNKVFVENRSKKGSKLLHGTRFLSLSLSSTTFTSCLERWLSNVVNFEWKLAECGGIKLSETETKRNANVGRKN